ncbi:MAG: hypothetical protein DI536_04445 [Archangium gephyra]|uniref:Uncharacterized protein n=1 Tax=Archangium gephyra TaxID=48 RepID=A0A2W5TPT9_9BACT|nr:MAG: hypothetical protein DI536_04445 [Archangium gephyra]
MRFDTDSAIRFVRSLHSFRVDAVERLTDDSGEHAVRGSANGREVEVRFVENSGEFRLVTDDGVEELTRSDLRDLGPALAQYQRSVPWTDSVTGAVIKAVNEAVFPTTLADLRVRNVSDLGRNVLLTGRTSREEIDVVFDARSGDLTIIVTANGRKAPRRPMTSQESWDLSIVLRAMGKVTPAMAMLIEAARRHAHH